MSVNSFNENETLGVNISKFTGKLGVNISPEERELLITNILSYKSFSNLKTLKKALKEVVKTNDPDEILKFAKSFYYLPTKVINSLAKALLKTKSISHIREFAKEVSNPPIFLLNIIPVTDLADDDLECIINNYLNSTFKSDPYKIILFIYDYINASTNYQRFAKALLNVMKNKDEYRILLSVYLDYIANPYDYNDRETEILYYEYVRLVKPDTDFSVGFCGPQDIYTYEKKSR